jgi:hypothetical protein
MSYDDVVLQEAVRFARTPIERSFGGAWSASKRVVLTITHRLAHLIVRAERDRLHWTMVGAKYYLLQLESAIGTRRHFDSTLQSFRDRLHNIVIEYERAEGKVDADELERLVVLSGNTPDRILAGQAFENSASFYSGPLKIESRLSNFVACYMWDQT